MGGWDSKLAGEIGARQGSQFSAGIHEHCVCWGWGGVCGAPSQPFPAPLPLPLRAGRHLDTSAWRAELGVAEGSENPSPMSRTDSSHSSRGSQPRAHGPQAKGWEMTPAPSRVAASLDDPQKEPRQGNPAPSGQL